MYKRINFKQFEDREDVTIGEILDSVEDGEFKLSLELTYTSLQKIMTVEEMMILSTIIEDLTGEKLESPLHLVEYLVSALDEKELVKLILTMIHMGENNIEL